MLTLLVPVFAAAIQPLIVPEQPRERAREVIVDRSSAQTLTRMKAPVRTHALEPFLQHEADLATLPKPVQLRGAGVGKIVVEGATSLRLRVSGATPGTVLLVAGEGDDSFERFEPGDSATWTPTTRGDSVYLTVESGGESLTISEVAAGTSQLETAANVCTQDVACTDAADDPEVAAAGRAVALIRFIRGKSSYVCTGGLMNDTHNSRKPYLLTARHCISTPEEAASVEAVWDYRAPGCGLAADSAQTRTYGAKLLVSSADTDMSLLSLDAIPANRVFLGVEIAPLKKGTPTYRVSHADGKPLKYSAGKVETSGAGCPTAPRPRYVYTEPTAGAVAQGSSGAPLLLPGLRVAGQLFAMCGPSPNDPCAVTNDIVDGSIAASWPLLAPYLDPPAPPAVRRRATRH